MLPATVGKKYVPPALPAGHLRRPRLLERLAEGLAPSSRLTLVQGGPGTGKTILLADQARQVGVPVVWLGLSPSDRDGLVFFSHLVAGIRQVHPGLSGRAAEILGTLGGAGAPQAMGALCDELGGAADAAMFLVVDDAQHLAGDPATLEGLSVLVGFFPEDGQVILSGRSLPALGLARLAVEGRLTRVGEAELAFTPQEVESILAGGHDPELAGRVWERTRGWAVGVSYALSEGARPPDERLESPELLYAYFAEEVLPGLAPAFRQNLLRCAFLPRLDAEACRTLLGAESDAFLRSLAKLQALAVPTEEGLEFQPIFREFLQCEAFGSWPQGELEALFRQLAGGAASRADAVGFLLQAGDFQEAEARLTSAAPVLLREGRDATIRSLIDGFPPARRQESAGLRHLQGELARRDGHLAEAIEHFTVAGGLAAGSGGNELLGRIWAGLAATYGAGGDVARQGEFALRALDLLQDGDPVPLIPCLNVLGMYHYFRHEHASAEEVFRRALDLARGAGDPAAEAGILHNLGLVGAGQGDFVRAIAYYQECIRLATAAGRLPFPLTYNNLALCLLYLGRSAEAWEAAEQGMALAVRIAARRDRVFLLRTLGHLSLRHAEHLRAREYFEASLAEATDTGDRFSRTFARLGLAELAIAAGRLGEARLEVEQAALAAGRPLDDPEMREAATILAELEIAEGDFGRAHGRLEALGKGLEDAPDSYRAFHLARLWRRSCLGLDDHAGAAAHAGRARELAARFGYPLPRELEAESPPGLAATEPDMPGPTAPASAPDLEVRDPAALAIEADCLGLADVRVDGRPRKWRAGNAKLLLAYFLMSPGGATAEQLRELLHPDGEPSRTAVHMAITRLRASLEPAIREGAASRFILFQDGRYLFNRGVRHRFDVAEFRQLVRHANQTDLPAAQRLGLLTQALRLYRGPFLVEYPDVAWCQLERENLRRQMQEAYETAFALLGEQDSWLALEELAEANLALEPCAEQAYRAKMVALAMLERTQDAMRIGSLAREALRRHLASDIEPETEELLSSIRDGRLTVKGARSYLPCPW